MASGLKLPLWGLLILTLMTPALAGCDPSPAVVAVASVLSTLAVVALLLLALYFFKGRTRRKGDITSRSSHYQTHGMVNRAFSHPEEGGAAEQGFATPRTLNNHKPKEFPKSSRDRKTWSSLPPTDRNVDGISARLDRQGSCGSWDDGFSKQDPEVISVTLESQDIIGLGFNISGNISSGIQVSEVHNRGPARDSGVVAVGDRILSVSVSYENIVYEDALTILSYASPYPVKLLLEKSPSQAPPSPILGPRPRRLSHPLFRSRSQEALDNPPSPSPKRSRSAVTKHAATGKDTGSRLFSKWKSGGGRLGSNNRSKASPPEGDESFQKSGLQKSWATEHNISSHTSDTSSSPHHSQEVTTVAIVSEEGYKEVEVNSPISYDEHDGAERENFNLKELSVPSKPAVSDAMTHHPAGAVHVKAAPPGKPERKNRRKSDLQYEQQTSSGSHPDQASTSLLPSPTTEVLEEAIVPAKKDRKAPEAGSENKSVEETRDLEGALEMLRSENFSSLEVERPPSRVHSPPGDPVEEEQIVPSARATGEANNNIKALTDFALDSNNIDNNDSGESNEPQPKQHQQKSEPEQPPHVPPGLDDEALERIIAMNSFPPGTQGWAGLQAGGLQGGIRDDFVPNHPLFTSYPAVSDTRSISSSSSNSTGVHSNNNINYGLAYEIRDDLVTGRPVVVGLGGKGRVATSGRQDSAASDTTTTSSSKGQGQGEGSECSDSLDWSGQRLVRSPSFSNIFIAD